MGGESPNVQGRQAETRQILPVEDRESVIVQLLRMWEGKERPEFTEAMEKAEIKR